MGFTLTEATEEGDTETSAIFAGTGSNIKLTPKSSSSKTHSGRDQYNLEVFKPEKKKRKEAGGAKTDVKKSLNRLYKDDAENLPTSTLTREEDTSDTTLSDDLKEKLREQARRISAKFKGKKPEVPEKEEEKKSENNKKLHKAEELHDHAPEASTSHQSNVKLDSIKPVSSEKEKRRHKHEHKNKKLEGERVEGLVKARRYKAPVQDTMEQQKVAESQDDYVLGKLFSKSGVIG